MRRYFSKHKDAGKSQLFTISRVLKLMSEVAQKSKKQPRRGKSQPKSQNAVDVDPEIETSLVTGVQTTPRTPPASPGQTFELTESEELEEAPHEFAAL